MVRTEAIHPGLPEIEAAAFIIICRTRIKITANGIHTTISAGLQTC